MGNQEIIQKLWNLCNVLRDDGITYHQYVTELTYILFLKMMQETGEEKNIEKNIVNYEELKKKNEEGTITKNEQQEFADKKKVAEYSWERLVSLSGIELKKYYEQIIHLFGEHCRGHIKSIYHNARTNIEEPKNLEKIIRTMNDLDWYSIDQEGFGDLYEGLLEKNANEKKSGAGQYFTPRVLIDVMTQLVQPQLGEHCNDPACGFRVIIMTVANSLRKSRVSDSLPKVETRRFKSLSIA